MSKWPWREKSGCDTKRMERWYMTPNVFQWYVTATKQPGCVSWPVQPAGLFDPSLPPRLLTNISFLPRRYKYFNTVLTSPWYQKEEEQLLCGWLQSNRPLIYFMSTLVQSHVALWEILWCKKTLLWDQETLHFKLTLCYMCIWTIWMLIPILKK